MINDRIYVLLDKLLDKTISAEELAELSSYRSTHPMVEDALQSMSTMQPAHFEQLEKQKRQVHVFIEQRLKRRRKKRERNTLKQYQIIIYLMLILALILISFIVFL